MREHALTTAAQMKRDGLSPEMIAKYTGLTTEDIKAIQER